MLFASCIWERKECILTPNPLHVHLVFLFFRAPLVQSHFLLPYLSPSSKYSSRFGSKTSGSATSAVVEFINWDFSSHLRFLWFLSFCYCHIDQVVVLEGTGRRTAKEKHNLITRARESDKLHHQYCLYMYISGVWELTNDRRPLSNPRLLSGISETAC